MIFYVPWLKCDSCPAVFQGDGNETTDRILKRASAVGWTFPGSQNTGIRAKCPDCLARERKEASR